MRREAQQDLRRGVQPRTQGPVQSRHGEKVKLDMSIQTLNQCSKLINI